MFLFVGLGNPGRNYAMNRHNIGFMAVDLLAYSRGFPAWQRKAASLQTIGQIDENKIILLKPQNYMNKSGLPVAELARFYQIPDNNIFVFHDDLDLAAGRVRVKHGGGHGGHNGLRDIISSLGNESGFKRLRIGIGHPGDSSKVTNYVLNSPLASEKEEILNICKNAIETIPLLIDDQWDKALLNLHTKKR